MGLSDPTLVAPAPKGIVDPKTGKPAGADDPFFLGVLTVGFVYEWRKGALEWD